MRGALSDRGAPRGEPAGIRTQDTRVKSPRRHQVDALVPNTTERGDESTEWPQCPRFPPFQGRAFADRWNLSTLLPAFIRRPHAKAGCSSFHDLGCVGAGMRGRTFVSICLRCPPISSVTTVARQGSRNDERRGGQRRSPRRRNRRGLHQPVGHQVGRKCPGWLRGPSSAGRSVRHRPIGRRQTGTPRGRRPAWW